jgi:hypothetical protein
MLGYHNERRWVRHVHATPDLLGMFPAMLTQSGYHRRLKTAQPLLCKTIITLATCCPSWFDDPAPRCALSYPPLSGERLEVRLWA